MTALESLQTRLEADLSVVCGHLNVLHERLVSITKEALETAAWEGQGVNTPAAWLAWQTGLSPVRAREIVMIAHRQTELPHTFRAFADGLLSVDQVAVVTKRVPAHNDREACELAQSATVAQLRVAMSKHFLPSTPKPEPEPSAAPAEPTHRVSVGFDDDGDFFLHGLVDSVDGAIINNALSEAKDALFTAGNTNVTWLDASTRGLPALPRDGHHPVTSRSVPHDHPFGHPRGVDPQRSSRPTRTTRTTLLFRGDSTVMGNRRVTDQPRTRSTHRPVTHPPRCREPRPDLPPPGLSLHPRPRGASHHPLASRRNHRHLQPVPVMR